MQEHSHPAGSELSVTALQLSAKDKLRRNIKTLGLKFLSGSGLAGLVGRVYGGKGVILMFHEFTRAPEEKLGQGTRIEDFEAVLRRLKRAGRDIVDLSEAVRRLADPESRPFAVLTFDDGYRSNIELALPVMEKHQAPATIYVPTEVITRSLNSWWLGLREIVLTKDSFDFEPENVRFECSDYPGKVATFRHLLAWVWQDFSRAETLEQVFTDNQISLPDLVERFFINENQMIEADKHPLIEIGAHTTTHRALRLLSESEVKRDIGDNKIFLEDRLNREVPHFAFPYGRPSLTGRREADIVKSLGFKTAVTTDPGCLFPQHGDDLFLLPRQDAEYPDDGLSHAVCGVNGFYRAMVTRGGAPAANVALEL
jgi:peptidoglycan/xylan/chitin deacetylase (PgdA/CDA1 family)